MAISRILILSLAILLHSKSFGEQLPKGTVFTLNPDCYDTATIGSGMVCISINGKTGTVPAGELNESASLESEDDEGATYRLKRPIDFTATSPEYTQPDSFPNPDINCKKTSNTFSNQLQELSEISEYTGANGSLPRRSQSSQMQRNLDCTAQLKKLLAMPGSKPQLRPGAFDDIVKQGVNSDALKAAIDGLNNAVKQGIIKNPHSFVVTDYSKKSSEPRMHIITLDKQGRPKVESVKTAHGKGSDLDNDGEMDCFNNGSGEQGTPRGAHVAGGTYDGKHGNSLRLHGLDRENANTCSRSVVIHESEYVTWPTPGRSYGCPALDPAVCEDVINAIQGGTFVYNYGRQPNCN